jgi:hypothetical protein
MEFETQAYNEIKKYLESLGYPSTSIFPEYNIRGSKIDVVVKSKDKVLIAIEIKENSAVKPITVSEIGYHPITRSLQKIAFELKAKFYLLSDGEQHIWLKTGQSGRPEKTVAIPYNQLNAHTLSEFEFTGAVLKNVSQYIQNFPITGDHQYDISIVLYAKLCLDVEKQGSLPINVQDIIGAHYINEKSPSNYAPEEILKEALERLKDIDLIDNRIAVFEFIDDFFDASRKEWNVPRWMADFMVSLIHKDKQSNICDLFSRSGILTSAAYLRGFQHVSSYYTSHKELYWIKVQQILGNRKESEVKFEPGLLKGDFGFVSSNGMDAVLLAPPFNLKFEDNHDSDFGQKGIKDGNTLFLEVALEMTNNAGQVIAIVPDGFLLSGLYKRSRRYFQSIVEAIIGLPEGAFKPYSAVKTSLVVLRKDRSLNHENVFMASLNKVPDTNPLLYEYDDAIKHILNNLGAFRTGKEITASEEGFVVKKLDAENFHVSKYWLNERAKSSDVVQFGFATLPLKEVIKSISRGSPIVRDPDGQVPYINPAVVRELRLNKEKLSYTTEKNLANNKIKQVFLNDVLVNIIGSYRGNAALVSKEFEGMAVNHHLAIIKANTDLILPGYLAVVLNSQFVQDQLHDQASGTVIPALNISSFEQIVLLVPNLETQEQIYEEYALRLNELATIQTRAKILEGEISQRLSNLGKEGDKL